MHSTTSRTFNDTAGLDSWKKRKGVISKLDTGIYTGVRGRMSFPDSKGIPNSS